MLQEKTAALRERTAAIRERDGLKQQCTAAIRQWDNALRERNEFRDAFIKVRTYGRHSGGRCDRLVADRMSHYTRCNTRTATTSTRFKLS